MFTVTATTADDQQLSIRTDDPGQAGQAVYDLWNLFVNTGVAASVTLACPHGRCTYRTESAPGFDFAALDRLTVPGFRASHAG